VSLLHYCVPIKQFGLEIHRLKLYLLASLYSTFAPRKENCFTTNIEEPIRASYVLASHTSHDNKNNDNNNNSAEPYRIVTLG
jgi:hypothetical protein